MQAWALFKVTAIPALLMAIPFGALVTVVTSGLVNQVGATSLLARRVESALSARVRPSLRGY